MPPRPHNRSTRRRSRQGHKTLRRIRTLPKLPPRKRDSHKGTFGRVLIIGGSRGMIGAPALAANAAMRTGAGLCTVACPISVQQAIATLCPCATTIPLPETKEGLVEPRKSLDLLKKLGLLSNGAGPSVVAAGPGLGLGNSAHSRAVVSLCRAFTDLASIPTILDADAINALAESLHTKRPLGTGRMLHNTVLTPHPGEMARLCGCTSRYVQGNRQEVATETAKMLAGRPTNKKTDTQPTKGAPADHPILLLKGADTIVTDGQRFYTNKTGNPGMATGGSGDVLTGIIAALIAQGLALFDAAILGAHVHGLAGDAAAKKLGQASLIATDLIEHLPEAMKRVSSRR